MINLPKPPLLGLDMRADAVSMVSLFKRKQQFCLDYVDREVLPSRAEPENAPAPEAEALSEAIRTMLVRSKMRSKSVATALPAEKTIVKVISLPENMSTQEIDEQIQFQGNQYIPFSMDAVHFDFSVLPGAARPGYQDVLLVACKKESLEEHVAILEEAGLKPKIADSRTFALWFLYTHLKNRHLLGNAIAEDKDKGVVLIETGYAKFHLYVFENGRPVYEREHRFGYRELLKTLQSHYALGPEDALRMARFGGLPSEYEPEILTPFTQKASAEIVLALDFFQNSMPDVPITSVCLFGEWMGLPPEAVRQAEASSRSGLADLSRVLQQKLAFPVLAPDPFAGMDISAHVHTRFLDADRSAFAVACGLALRRFYA